MQSPKFEKKADPFAGAVGIYVPGGTAVLPSSALMLSVPAGLAGCPTIVLATPPRPDGSISPEVTSRNLLPESFPYHLANEVGAASLHVIMGTVHLPRWPRRLAPTAPSALSHVKWRRANAQDQAALQAAHP